MPVTMIGRETARIQTFGARAAVRLAAFAVTGLVGSTVTAANLTWDPAATGSATGGGAGTWDKTLINWYDGATDVVWTDGNTATFANTGGTVSLGVPISALNLQVTGTGYTITPSATNTLTLTGGFGVSAAGATIYAGGASGSVNTIAGPITIAANTTAAPAYITAAAGNTLNLPGVITQATPNTSGETVFGPGTVNYSGAGFAAGKFNVQGGATFNSSGTMTGFTGTYVGVSDAVTGTTWNINAGSAITSAAALFLGNGGTTSGTATVNGGTSTFGNGAAASISVGAGFSGVGDGTGTLTVNGGSIAAGTSGVKIGSNKSGIGVVNLNGGVLASAGAITTAASTGTGTGGSGTINFNGGTLQSVGSALSVSNTIIANVGGGGVVVDTNGGAASVAANLIPTAGSTGGVVKNGVGTLTFSGTNTYAGNTTVNAGTLAASLIASLPGYNTPGKVTVASGAFLSFGYGNTGGFTTTDIATARANVTFAAGSGLGLDVATAQTYSDSLSGFANFVKTGVGTLTLTGNNTYTGTTNIAGGVLALGSATAIPATGLNFGGATVGISSSDSTVRTIANPLTIAGVATLTLGNTGTGDLNFTDTTAFNLGAGARTFTVNVPTTFTQGLAGSLTLTKGGVGMLTLNGAGTVAGIVNLASGSGNTRITNGAALGTAVVNVQGQNAATGTLELANNITVANVINSPASRNDPTTATPGVAHVRNVSGNNTITSTGLSIRAGGLGTLIESLAGTLTFTGGLQGTLDATAFARPYDFFGAGNFVVSGVIANGTSAGGTNVVKYGGGTLTLGGANTYAAGTVVTGGTVAVTDGGSFGTGAVTNNANVAFTNTGALAVANVISGAGTVAKSAAGTVTLTGANTYTGVNTITGGTLRVTTAASTPVLSGAGTNIQNGQLVVDYTGNASPAVTIRGLLAGSFTDATTPGVMDSGVLRSSTATAARGLGYRDDGAGTVTIKATLFGDADLDGGVSINDFNALAGNFGQSTGKVWVDGDFDYDGGVSINDFNLLAGNFGQSLPASAESWSGLLAFAAAHNDLAAFEAVTGVPEPTSLGLIAAGASLGLRRRRNRV